MATYRLSIDDVVSLEVTLRTQSVRNPAYGAGMDVTPKLDLVILDCPDALVLGRFYADVLGWGMEDGGDERFCTLVPPGGGITPDNPDGWKVEAGNVGLHYYDWRYNSSATLDPTITIRVPATANPGPRHSVRQLWRMGFN